MKPMQPRHPDGGQRTGVGFIGCGGHACGNNIPGAAANPNLELVALCDLRTDVLDRLKRQYTPKLVTTDMEDVFKDPAVGLVVCATKPDVRIPVMKLAVKYRKPLFVESPWRTPGKTCSRPAASWAGRRFPSSSDSTGRIRR